MTRVDWIIFNYRWVPIISAVVAMGAASYIAFLFYSSSSTPNEGLFVFLFVVKLVVPVILVGIGAAWLAIKVLYWWYDR